MKKILLLDCTIDVPWSMGNLFRNYFEESCIEVRRAPQEDFPVSLAPYSHILISGSKTSCLEEAPWIDQLCQLILSCTENKKPVLGVCFGHQMIARAAALSINQKPKQILRKAKTAEFGLFEIEHDGRLPIFEGLPKKFECEQSHFEEIYETESIFLQNHAKSKACKVQAIRWKDQNIFGVQFHPEKNTKEGKLKDVPIQIFKNFIKI